MNENLTKCTGPDCQRQVMVGVRYCCTACNPHSRDTVHSGPCESRHNRRGEWTGP